MINVIQVDEFEKFTNALDNIASAIENMPTPSGGIDYSTQEQDTGLKWIDGKNIYQITLTGSGSSDYTLPIDLTNLNIIDYKGIWIDSDNIVRGDPWSTTGTWFRFYIGSIYNGVYVECNKQNTCYITLYYTKTS